MKDNIKSFILALAGYMKQQWQRNWKSSNVMSNPGDFLNPFQFNVVLSFIGFQDELKAIWGKVYIYIGNCHGHFFNFDKNIFETFMELNKLASLIQGK